ncbi:MAG: hypothetical protein Q7K45_01990 [Nanoarchaeota archaeon]|nr:hypothetical protein [Nanoarchaeota archaeon]
MENVFLYIVVGAKKKERRQKRKEEKKKKTPQAGLSGIFVKNAFEPAIPEGRNVWLVLGEI